MSAVMELTITERIARAHLDVLLGSADEILDARQLLGVNDPGCGVRATGPLGGRARCERYG